MTFDEELKRAVDSLGERLKDDISRELRLLTDELSASAKADRETAASLAAAAATEAAQTEAGQATEVAVEAAIAAAAEVAARAAEAATEAAKIETVRATQAAVEAATAEAATRSAEAAASSAVTVARSADDKDADGRPALNFVLGAIRAIDQARSLGEILDTLMTLVTGATGAGQEAARAGVLLVQGGRVRGWRFAGFPPSFDGSQLDLPLGKSGIIGHAVEHQRAAASASDGPAPPFAALSNGGEALAIPMALAGEVVAVLYVEHGRSEPGTRNLDNSTLEVLARHAARALEALTAFKTAGSIARADAGAARPVENIEHVERVADGTNGGGSRGLTSEDEDQAARRYARLVISEIKLYHEDAVAEGRRDRNLATRLGGEIARARALYEERVPVHLRGAAEHFHAELVRTLAGGDASLFEPVEKANS